MLDAREIYPLSDFQRNAEQFIEQLQASHKPIVLTVNSKASVIMQNAASYQELLEFTLTQLWQKPRTWFLTHSAYQEIGGLEKALANYADMVLDKLNQDDKKRAEKIFIQLVCPGEGTEDT